MNVQQALSMIHAPKGVTSVIAGVMSGDTGPLQAQNATGASLEKARQELERVQHAQANCKSDWAYWGYQGDASYWSAVVNILEAAELVGPDSLPDIPAPEDGGVVMDVCANIERFGKAILTQAQSQRRREG